MFSSPYGSSWGLDPAQIKIIYEKLTRMSQVFRETALLKANVGFEVKVFHTAGAGGPIKDGATLRMPRSTLSILLFRYIQRCSTCPIEPEAESSTQIYLAVNDLDGFYDSWQQPFARDAAAGMYLAPLGQGQLAGFPLYQAPGKGSKLLITSDNTRPVWVPVSQERYILGKISTVRNQIAKMKPPYDQNGRREIADLEAELAGMSAERRAAPAYIDSARSTRRSGLGSAHERGARAIVVTNTEFFDRTRPKTSFQMAEVETYPQDLLMRAPDFYMGRVVVDVMKTVDWKRIAALIQ